ncbi:MAG: GNAT family N-acetyltransferase [Bacillus sp. (in: Bacteria)]|nr:GNAT family N-acetyltransferase [Bacillus sp. (in: firmicutes)]
MASMEVKILTEEDINIYWLLRLEALQNNPEAFAATLEETLTGDDPKQNIKSFITGEGMATYGAFVDGRLAAVATVRRFPLEKMKHKGSLLGMYVSKTVRGQGIGKRLMEAIIEDSKKKKP